MLPKSEFARNVLKMLTGTTLAQGISFLAALVLARLYTDADFGRLALYISMVTLIAKMATLRYELAIILPKKEEDAANVLVLSLCLGGAISLMSLLIIMVCKDQIYSLLNNEDLQYFIYLVPLSVLLLSWYECFRYWHTREKRFGLLANTQVGQTLAGVSSQIGLAWWSTTFGLIGGTILKHLTGFTLLGASFRRAIGAIRRQTSWVGMRQVAYTYREFPKVNAPHVGVDLIQNEGTVFLIAYYFEEAVLGLYAFALRVVRTPLALIGNALTQVFYQKGNEDFQQDKQQLPILIVKIYKRLFWIGLPSFTLLFFIAPALFAFLFGEQWREAGVIARILTPWLLFHFMASPVSQTPLIVDRQRGAFWLAVISGIVKLGALIYGGYTEDYIMGFILLSIGGSLLMIYTLWWYLHIAKQGAHAGIDAK